MKITIVIDSDIDSPTDVSIYVDEEKIFDSWAETRQELAHALIKLVDRKVEKLRKERQEYQPVFED